MTKVTKKKFADFKNVVLTPKKTSQIKGGTAEIVIVESLDT